MTSMTRSFDGEFSYLEQNLKDLKEAYENEISEKDEEIKTLEAKVNDADEEIEQLKAESQVND